MSGSAPVGWQAPKTNWAANNVVVPGDMNRAEGNSAAIETGDRTIDPAEAPTGNVGTLRQLLDWITNRFAAHAGGAKLWHEAPDTTLADAKGHIDATAPHSATAAATPNLIVLRDENGRAAFADPLAAGDVATKDYVDVGKHLSLNEQTGDSYTLVIADDGKLIDMNKATAQTLTVPAEAAVAFIIGTQILVRQKGAGQVTISPADGVTLQSPDSLVKTYMQYSIVGLLKTAADTWNLLGDLGA